MLSKRKGEFILKHKRILFGKILLDEKLLMENNIYHDVEVEYYKVKRNDESALINRNEIYGIEIIKRDSRRYAKRQITWFRRYDSAKWFNLDEYHNFDILEKEILSFIEVR